MATSYKTMYLEARWEADRLQEEVQRMRTILSYSNDEAIHEVERTRQVVDLAGISRHMLVDRYTPQQWKQRGHLPPVDFPDINEPLWYVSTLKEKFVVPTRRIWHDHPELTDEEDRLDVLAHRRVRYGDQRQYSTE